MEVSGGRASTCQVLSYRDYKIGGCDQGGFEAGKGGMVKLFGSPYHHTGESYRGLREADSGGKTKAET